MLMMMLAKLSLSLIILFPTYSSATLSFGDCSTDPFLGLSDADLLAAATGGKTIGQCRITGSCDTCACQNYVKAVTLANGENGWPPESDTVASTGCVADPQQSVQCFYTGNSLYSAWPLAEMQALCASQVGLENAVAQLRHAIANCGCDETHKYYWCYLLGRVGLGWLCDVVHTILSWFTS